MAEQTGRAEPAERAERATAAGRAPADRATSAPQRVARPGQLLAGALVLGVGAGGLADGIVLHQVLQWHNLVSDVEPRTTLDGLERNVTVDGVFHLVTAALAGVGVLLTWRGGLGTGGAGRSLRSVVGLVLVGWGVFHVLDQLLFHLVLGLHDIRDAAEHPGLYNWGFFAIGLVLVAAGAALQRGAGTSGARDALPRA